MVPKPYHKWRPILDLSNLNKFFKAEKFKFETPETIRTSFQTGEWVTSTDFKNAYFHIPIQSQSRKDLRFHVQGQTYQFKALSVHSSHGVHYSDQRGQTEGKVRPTLDQWQTLTAKIQELLAGPTCPVQQLMYLIGLLTATGKQVRLGRLYMGVGVCVCVCDEVKPSVCPSVQNPGLFQKTGYSQSPTHSRPAECGSR